MPRYWCVSFDANAGPCGGMDEDYVLLHGLERKLWLMQYQYAHDGHDYQATPRGNITRNWNAAGNIRVGDWCAAHLRGCRFYAIGKVILPRLPLLQQDTFERTRRERHHIYLCGTVAYPGTSDAFYEDFTDDWNLTLNNFQCIACQAAPAQLQEVWRYLQRIDVKEWVCRVREGVNMSGEGLADAVIAGSRRNAAFEISEPFFERIRGRLQDLQRAVTRRLTSPVSSAGNST
jgi:hypothetical protein